MPDSGFRFHGASSGSKGNGPWTGPSSCSSSDLDKKKNNQTIKFRIEQWINYQQSIDLIQLYSVQQENTLQSSKKIILCRITCFLAGQSKEYL